MVGAAAPTGQAALRSTSAGMVAVGAAAWFATVVWMRSEGMGAMPGTMEMTVVAFVAMWALMMTAMMLPSVAPVAGLYARTVTANRTVRITAFGSGYLVGWVATGVAAYALADVFAGAAGASTVTAKAVAAGTFAVCGAYQLTPLKERCLSHCRSPLSHLLHYVSFTGPTRDLRAGLHHGLYCVGCCWTLMVLMVAFGVMNLLAMAGLALVIAVEKHWRHGRAFSRVVGVVALALAVVVVIEPGLAPGLDPGREMGGETPMPMEMG
jgi:predicted metal-binding membrane protein